jgi:hypothetical protein
LVSMSSVLWFRLGVSFVFVKVQVSSISVMLAPAGTMG